MYLLIVSIIGNKGYALQTITLECKHLSELTPCRYYTQHVDIGNICFGAEYPLHTLYWEKAQPVEEEEAV